MAMQQDLFSASEPPAPLATLFADIVFDRPLDQAYTYAVGEPLREAIAVGKRVQAPFGRGDRPTIGYCIGVHGTAPEREAKQIQAVLDEEPLLTDSLLRLTRWMADYYLCGWGQVLQAVVPIGARAGAGTRWVTLVEALPTAEAPLEPSNLTVKQRAALELLRAETGPILPRHLMQMARCGTAPLEALLKLKLIRRVRQRVEHFEDSSKEHVEPEPPIHLNADQLTAWAPLERALRDGGFQPFLLHGVTGSGKTEIYLRAIEEVVRQGKEAIVLVPEISLTPQTIQRFRGRCANVAVLHSHLGDAERGGHWRRVAKGQVQVVVGARSAVFAPTRHLGLLVIDEEHESSFKQEATPRYHGRDVAVMRARLENVPILLGSATPSLESWYNARRGQYTLLELPQRVLERPLPPVVLVDRRHEEAKHGRFPALSQTLERGIHDALRDGGQVILLLNRRGFSTHVHCPVCGHVETCKHCDLALTFHRQRNTMLCHYCGYEQQPLEACPKCTKAVIRYQGLGTEKLEEEIANHFPGHVIRRMDSDSTRGVGSHGRILSAFRQGLVHILLGTQMIAKGLDFPNVTLVGVINADIGLHVPDFRASERTFQLLSQVAGRAGRGPLGGRVLVQTFTPDHLAIALAASHDFNAFANMELALREAHLYPPWQRLARVVVRGKTESKTGAFADLLAGAFATALQRLASVQPAQVRILGPAECPVFRLKGLYRYHFQLHSPSPAALHQVLRMVVPSQRPPGGVEFIVDIDPHNML